MFYLQVIMSFFFNYYYFIKININYVSLKDKLQKISDRIPYVIGLWGIIFLIKLFGFIKNEKKSCIYKRTSASMLIFLILYVDDILLIGNVVPMLTTIKRWLSKEFSMKDLGKASYILGIKVYRDTPNRILCLLQQMYIESVLKKFSMENFERGFLPLRHGISPRRCALILLRRFIR